MEHGDTLVLIHERIWAPSATVATAKKPVTAKRLPWQSPESFAHMRAHKETTNPALQRDSVRPKQHNKQQQRAPKRSGTENASLYLKTYSSLHQIKNEHFTSARFSSSNEESRCNLHRQSIIQHSTTQHNIVQRYSIIQRHKTPHDKSSPTHLRERHLIAHTHSCARTKTQHNTTQHNTSGAIEPFSA